MATYRLKRKTFAFALTRQAFKAAGQAFKSGNVGTGLLQSAKGLGRGAIGVGKIAAVPAAAATAGAMAFDNITNN